MNGIGTPVAGKNELATDIFKNAWKQIEKVSPTAKSLPYISGHLDAITNPRCNNVQNSTSTRIHPMKPSSSPTTAKIKSVCASGNHASFCLDAPNPAPYKPPDANATND